MARQIKYLIRNLTIIEEDGRVSCHKLVYLSGCLDDGVINSYKITPYEKEEPGSEYIAAITIKIVLGQVYIV